MNCARCLRDRVDSHPLSDLFAKTYCAVETTTHALKIEIVNQHCEVKETWNGGRIPGIFHCTYVKSDHRFKPANGQSRRCKVCT